MDAWKILDAQHDLIVRDFKHASPQTPALQRQRELYDRWESARTIVDAPTASAEDTPPAAAGSSTPPQ